MLESGAPWTVRGGEALSWFGHMRANLALGLPLVGAQLAQVSINVTDTVMIGWLGAPELAAAVLATQTYFLFWLFGSGFAMAVMPLAASAEGRGDVRGVRRSTRMGLWVLILYAALTMLPLWYTEQILLFLGQDPQIAAIAGDYARVVQWSMFPAVVVIGLRSYLTVLGRAHVVLLITLASALANAVLDYAFIFGAFGAPALGVVGAAGATLGTNLFAVAATVAYTLMKSDLRRYELYVRWWRPDWSAFAEVVRLGWPIGAAIIAEVGLFTASSIMMGWMGTAELAAHGIALQLASIAFMVPLGLGSAATVRVGLAFGRDDWTGVARAGGAALGVAAAIAVFAAILFWVFPEALIGLFLDEGKPNAASVIALAVPLLAVAAAFQIVDSMQAVATGILRGLKDTRVPMMIAVFSYWLLGMPVAYALAFAFDWGPVGIWWGLALGLLAAAALLSLRFVRRIAPPGEPRASRRRDREE